MLKNILYILLILVLTSCDGAYASAPPNLDAREADARATQAAVQIARQATQDAARAADQAEREQQFQSTLEAAQTADAADAEIRLLAARGTATADAYHAQATATRVAYNAGIDATETALAYARTQPALTATAQAIDLRAKRERDQAVFRTYAPWLILGLVIIALVAIWRQWSPWMRLKLFGVSQVNGSTVVLIPAGGRGAWLAEPNRQLAPVLEIGADSRQSAHFDGPPQQEAAGARAQLLDYAIATGKQAARPKKSITIEQPFGPEPHVSEYHDSTELDLPAWDLLERWQGPGLPLGVAEGGRMISADPEHQPHLLFAGTTDSGKTRYGLRPVTAAALAAGWQVIILDRSGLDYMPFDGHPNAHLVELHKPALAAQVLNACYGVLLERFAMLRDAKTSTWSRMRGGGPHVLIVMDEFSNLVDSLENKSTQAELVRGARMIAAEGRKAGVHLLLALQDPTYRSIDLNLRRNSLPIAFRVRDGDASRVIIQAGGAEELPRQHFLTRIGSDVLRGAAFHPSDREIRDYLDRRIVVEHPAPIWLADLPELPAPDGDRDQRIREMHAQGDSMNEIQQKIFGYTGGAAHAAVKAAIEAEVT